MEYWREIVEIVGLLSVVGGLVLVTLEIRQANKIARAHIHNIMWAAQTAHDNGLLSSEDLENYRNDLAGGFLEEWPEIVLDFIEIYETQPGKKSAYVFEPLAELAASDQRRMKTDVRAT